MKQRIFCFLESGNNISLNDYLFLALFCDIRLAIFLPFQVPKSTPTQLSLPCDPPIFFSFLSLSMYRLSFPPHYLRYYPKRDSTADCHIQRMFYPALPYLDHRVAQVQYLLVNSLYFIPYHQHYPLPGLRNVSSLWTWYSDRLEDTVLTKQFGMGSETHQTNNVTVRIKPYKKEIPLYMTFYVSCIVTC